MKELEKLIEELIFPFKNAPVVTLEGQEPITIDAKKLDETLDKAFRLGQESVSLPEDEGEFNPEAENWAEPVKEFIQIKKQPNIT